MTLALEQKEYETIMSDRIKRFPYLLKHAGLDFKQYQYEGVEFCLQSELRIRPIGNIRGGLIADEMGLGKTIMMIGTMFCNIVRRTLIVLPPILVNQWYTEILRISGHKALVYYGDKKRGISIDDLLAARIVITSYNNIAISRKVMKLRDIHRVVWDRVIYDEAHHLRNKKTIRFLGCKNIHARIRWFVSGTPIQNKKSDFYSLCNALGLPASIYTNTENLSVIRKLFILNRTKKEVGIDLQDAVKNTIMVPWNDKDERLVAEEIHSAIPMSGVSLAKSVGGSGSGSGQLISHLIKNDRLVAFLRAKQTCIMSSLMKTVVEKLINKGLVDSSYLDSIKNSSKLDMVVSMILSKRGNNKGKIVFSHYHEEIDRIAYMLRKNGLSVMVFDGRCGEKMKVNALSVKYDVLILQIQTGCEGLNLQEYYSEVYFVSPHWNPCVEDQAVARCHRIGQKQQVEVFTFVMDDFHNGNGEAITLEKYICNVQDHKREISREILSC